MATTEQRLTSLENSVMKLAANKADRTNLTEVQNLNITRYLDLHTAYVNMLADIEAIKSYMTNYYTGNNV